MKKPSFFERLTGSVHVDVDANDDYENDVVETDNMPSSLMETESEGELAVDVHQEGNNIIIKTMVAGVHPDDLEVNVTRDMVTVHGKREIKKEIADEDYFHRELYWGSFSRTIMLPAEVEPEEAKAEEEHGLLTIVVPKIDKHKQARLKVKAG